MNETTGSRAGSPTTTPSVKGGFWIKVVAIILAGTVCVAVAALILVILAGVVGLGFVVGKFLVVWLSFVLIVASIALACTLIVLATDQSEDWMTILFFAGGVLLLLFAGSGLITTILESQKLLELARTMLSIFTR